MIYLVKNQKESNEKLINRFLKKVQSSRIILLAKDKRYFKKPVKTRLIRKAAVKRDFYRALREKKKYM